MPVVLWTGGVSFVAAILCRLACGNSLGLFFGPMLLLPLILPPLAIGQSRKTVLWQCLAASAPVALVWLLPVFQAGVSIGAWFGCVLILLSFACALALLSRAIGFSSIVTFVALAWLTWPVWLSPALVQPFAAKWVDWLVPAHPLLAMNGLLQSLGIWSQQSLAYRLTNLGQDVTYALPGAVRSIVVQGVVGGVLGFRVQGSGFRRGKRET